MRLVCPFLNANYFTQRLHQKYDRDFLSYAKNSEHAFGVNKLSKVLHIISDVFIVVHSNLFGRRFPRWVPRRLPLPFSTRTGSLRLLRN